MKIDPRQSSTLRNLELRNEGKILTLSGEKMQVTNRKSGSLDFLMEGTLGPQ